MAYISPALTQLVASVKKAGYGLNRDFSEIEKLQASVKNINGFITAAYLKVEATLKLELSKTRPQVPYYEQGKPFPAEPCFVICPIDGLDNFANGIPYFTVSVAIVENSQVTSAVMYNPATDDMYFAEKGVGAFKEGFRSHERLRVSGAKDINNAIVCISKDVEYKDKFNNIRICGSTSLDLAYVAAGRYDACVNIGNSLPVMAAGLLLVKEAGGSVLEMNQKDIRTEDFSSALESGNVIGVNANLSKIVHELVNN